LFSAFSLPRRAICLSICAQFGLIAFMSRVAIGAVHPAITRPATTSSLVLPCIDISSRKHSRLEPRIHGCRQFNHQPLRQGIPKLWAGLWGLFVSRFSRFSLRSVFYEFQSCLEKSYTAQTKSPTVSIMTQTVSTVAIFSAPLFDAPKERLHNGRPKSLKLSSESCLTSSSENQGADGARNKALVVNEACELRA